MIKARKERVRELIRSLETVQVRSQALGKEKSGSRQRREYARRQVVLLDPTGAGKNGAAHSRREASDDILSAIIDHMRVAVGDDSHVGT